jgi:TIR domain
MESFMKTPFEHDIFISYSQKDREAAAKLQAAFEVRKLKVWRDERLADSPAESYIATINNAHDRSAKVIVLWSRNSGQSNWVHAEATRALSAGKIVPLALEPISALLPFIPMPFNILPTLDASADPVDLEPILRALGAEQVQGAGLGVVSLVTADVDISKLPDTYAKKLYGREREMADLIAAWDGGHTRIFAFDAMGGAGKTALVYHFVQALKASGWRGARSVFAWSFYSQGSNEDRQTSADEFFKAAFKHFSGGRHEPPKDPREKGVELAHLVQKQRALLILDGMEPLQYAAGRTGGGTTSSGVVGGVKDPGIKALLSLLADNNPGLCLVTTRIKLAELEGAEGVAFDALERLPLMAGIELLRDLGVVPDMPPAEYRLPQIADFKQLVPAYTPPATYAPPPADALKTMPARIAKEFIDAVEELKGHALALTLVGNYLAEQYAGDIRALNDLPSLPALHPANPARDPYRVMRAIEIGLIRQIAEQGKLKRPAETAAGRELALLFFLGLFDRPAETKLLPVVFPQAAADYLAADPSDIGLEKTLKDLDDSTRLPQDERDRRAAERKSRWQELEPAFEACHRNVIRLLFPAVRDITRGELQFALAGLARGGLVAKLDEKTTWDRATLDCHPLVREYFGARLKELDRETFKAAHGRLYNHYRYADLPQAFRDPVAYGVLALKAAYERDHYPRLKDGFLDGSLSPELRAQVPPSIAQLRPQDLREAFALVDGAQWEAAKAAFLPEDEAGMNPLFSAITHGCAAEREAETYAEVYRPRITRGNEDFASGKLGLYGQELAALASFFETPFAKPSPRLNAAHRALALNIAGFQLRALGRLEDAAEPMRAGIKGSEDLGNWNGAAQDAENLSELLVTIGRLSGRDGAVAAGEQAVAFADRSGDRGAQLARRTTHADALFQAGSPARAEALFREAETLQKGYRPDLPRLYSLQGSQYCDLLLARGRTTEAAARAAHAINVAQRNNRLLHIGLDTLTQARAALADAPPVLPAPQDCATRSAAALAALRRANQEAYIVPGLLAHAEALWRTGETKAGEPLREAETIAARGPMPLFMAEAQLLRGRILLGEHRIAPARHSRDAATALIEKHGYGRAAPELAVLGAEIACVENAPNRGAAIAAAFTAIRGESYHDERTGITIDGGWWGLLPRLEALLPAGHSERASLRAARDAYNAERDAYLAAEDAKAEAQWEDEDRALADADFRRELSTALVRAGYKPLDETPLSEQRNDARNYLKQMREARGEEEGPEVPDGLVRQVFVAPELQELLHNVMQQNDLPGAPADLPFETQRAIVAALMKDGIVKIGEGPQAGAPAPPSAVPPKSQPAAAERPSAWSRIFGGKR